MFNNLQKLLSKLYNQHGLDNSQLKRECEIFQSTYHTIQTLENTFNKVKPNTFDSKERAIIETAANKIAQLSENYVKTLQTFSLSALSGRIKNLDRMLSSIEDALLHACTPGRRELSLSESLDIDRIYEPKESSRCNFFWSLFYVSPEKRLYNNIVAIINNLNKELKLEQPQQDTSLELF